MNQCTSVFCNQRDSKAWSAVIPPISCANLCFLLRVGVFTLVLSRSSDLGAMIPSAVTTRCAILQLSDRHCTGIHHAAPGGIAGPTAGRMSLLATPCVCISRLLMLWGLGFSWRLWSSIIGSCVAWQIDNNQIQHWRTRAHPDFLGGKGGAWP